MSDIDSLDEKFNFHYETVTDNIRVQVQPVYLAEQSQPEHMQFIWAYRVRISNESSDTVQLLNRHWEIVDANGQKMVVDGQGVVGVQPTLEPQTSFEYTSGTPLQTPSGIMSGFYRVQVNGALLDVAIPAFALQSPHDVHVKH